MFISGSNTLFGVDTERIEKALKIPTVNYGVHAGLFYYNLDRAKKHLKPGDIIILPLEYSYYTWHHDIFGEEFSAYIIGYDSTAIKKLTIFDMLKFTAQQNTIDLAKFTFHRIVPPIRIESGYSSQYLNTNGDMTNNHIEKSYAPSSLKAKIGKDVFKEPPLTVDAKSQLTDFINYCQQNNIIIYAAWPNYLWKEKEFSGKDLDGIHAIEKFYRDHNVEILGNYTDCLYDAELFYDGTYHLNEEGKRIHTDYLIQLLKEKLP